MEQLILHSVNGTDPTEAARTWPSDHHLFSEEEAKADIYHIRDIYAKNSAGYIYHPVLAVSSKDDPHSIMGWRGPDSRWSYTQECVHIITKKKELPYRRKRSSRAEISAAAKRPNNSGMSMPFILTDFQDILTKPHGSDGKRWNSENKSAILLWYAIKRRTG